MLVTFQTQVLLMTSLIYIQMMPNEQIIRFQGIASFFMAPTLSFRNLFFEILIF